jgi:hypothetical protein
VLWNEVHQFLHCLQCVEEVVRLSKQCTCLTRTSRTGGPFSMVWRCCSETSTDNHILLQSGGGTWDTLCTLLEVVWVLGVGMLYVEDRGIQVPMTLEHDNIVGTQCCDTLSRVSSDLTRELGRGFQIGVIRSIRVDHTDFFKWILKLIHSPSLSPNLFLLHIHMKFTFSLMMFIYRWRTVSQICVDYESIKRKLKIRCTWVSVWWKTTN